MVWIVDQRRSALAQRANADSMPERLSPVSAFALRAKADLRIVPIYKTMIL